MKSSAAKKAAAKPRAAEGVPTTVCFGRIVELKSTGRVLLQSARGTVEARLPQHVDRAWVAAALEKGPVPAAYALPEEAQPGSVVAVYPGAEHEGVRTEVRLEGTRVSLRAGRATIVLENDDVRIRGREIVSRAHEEQRIRGARIRFN
jgi:hypothetical protein